MEQLLRTTAAGASTSSRNIDGDVSGQHSASIVQIESIDTSGGYSSGSSSSSQFITLDETGLVAVWMASEDVAATAAASSQAKKDISADEIGLSPRGMVKLIKRRVIPPDCRVFYSLSATNFASSASRGPSSSSSVSSGFSELSLSSGPIPVLAVDPFDPSVLLIGVGHGAVFKGSTTGSALSTANAVSSGSISINGAAGAIAGGSSSSASSSSSSSSSMYYKRNATQSVFVQLSNSKSADNSAAMSSFGSYVAPVSCIAISSPSAGAVALTDGQSSNESFVLVGRSDGTLDLFSPSSESPLFSWQLNAEFELCGEKSKSSAMRGVVKVSWLPSSCTSFMAIDNSGVVFVFDLQKDTSHPTEIDYSARDSAFRSIHPNKVDISGTRATKGVVVAAFIAIARGRSKSAGNGVKLSDGVLVTRRVSSAAMSASKKDISQKRGEAKDEEKSSEYKNVIPSGFVARDIVTQSKLVLSVSVENSRK